MTRTARNDLVRDARVFVAGAACGLLAGAFIVSLIVWQFGNVIGSRTASERYPAHAPQATARWGDGATAYGDVDVAVIERAPERTEPGPEGTAGSSRSGGDGTAVIGPVPSSPAGLEDRDLEMPVEGRSRRDLTRQFDEPRGGTRRHEAIDILAPRNTPVKAVEAGTIARLFHSRAGGITIYQFDPSQQFCYYYAHLERYAQGLKEGDAVRKGQIIGYVGTSGNAAPDTPHLHFAIFRLTAEKRWWEGTPIDPYDVLLR
jgi:murein DD-endopeptidase MepM/ murein hydrolase activator NlpD